MATGKRFYWIKLKDTFFTSDTVDFIMSQDNGAEYIVLYQMLHMKTANTGGRLQRQIGEMLIPYDMQKIKRDCKWFSEDTIRVALELYKQLGLVYEDSNGVLVMADHANMVGQETDWAAKKRRQRSEIVDADVRFALDDGDDRDDDEDNNRDNNGGGGDSNGENVPIDIRDKRIENRDKSIDTRVQSIDSRYKEGGIENDAGKPATAPKKSRADRDGVIPYGYFKNVMLRPEEREKLVAVHGETWVDYEIDSLSNAIAAGTLKTVPKDHYAALRNWIKSDKSRGLKPKPSYYNNSDEKKSDDPFEGMVSLLPDGIV